MLPETVIDRQVARQPLVAFLCVLARHSVAPFPAESRNKSLSFAVGAGLVGPGADVLEAQDLVSLNKAA